MRRDRGGRGKPLPYKKTRMEDGPPRRDASAKAPGASAPTVVNREMHKEVIL